MLQLTIYYGSAGSGQSSNAHRTTKALNHTILIEGFYSYHAFYLLADIMKQPECDPAPTHILITTPRPLPFLASLFYNSPNVEFVECINQPFKTCIL